MVNFFFIFIYSYKSSSCHTNGTENGSVDEVTEKLEKLLYQDDILYPTFFRQENTADKYLVSHCEFIDFSREMVNIKIDEDLSKVCQLIL